MRTIALLAVLAVAFAACEKEEEPQVSPRSSVKVNLPAKPELKEPEYKKAHADGVLTVEGLMRNARTYMGKTVQVRGKVTELVHCPEPEPYTEEEIEKFNQLHKKWDRLVKIAKQSKGRLKAPPEPVLEPKKVPRTCSPRPQAELVDEGGNPDFQLLVAGSMYSPIKDLKDGSVVTLEGTFDMVSPEGHYMRQAGLLYLKDLPEPAPEEEGAEGEGAEGDGSKGGGAEDEGK